MNRQLILRNLMTKSYFNFFSEVAKELDMPYVSFMQCLKVRGFSLINCIKLKSIFGDDLNMDDFLSKAAKKEFNN